MKKFILIIFALSVIVYANSIRGSFISDDIPTIVKNPEISTIKLSDNFATLSNSLLYRVAKFNPVPYHIFNVVLHALNSVLVFYLLLYFFSVWPSFLGALLFSVHPVHTEAVSWISGKPYLISTLFILASLLLYLYASSKDKIKISAYLLSLLLYIPALFVSWYAVFFPGLIMLHDFTYGRWKRNWKLWLPYIMNVMASLFINRHIISETIVNRVQMQISTTNITNPIVKMAFSLFCSAKLFLWPMKLTFYRDWSSIFSESIVSVFGFFVLVLCLLQVWFKKSKPLFFALGLFIIFLAPAYISVSTVTMLAERYLYLPSVSLCILAAYLSQRYSLNKISKIIVTLLLIIVIGGYSVRTILRNNDWRSPMTLWSAAVRTSPLSPVGYKNLGNAYYDIGEYERAISLFNKAIELRPDYTSVYNDLAAVYIRLGEYRRAISICKMALEIRPNDVAHVYLYSNSGAAYMALGDYKQAITAFKKAIEVRPDIRGYLLDASLYNNLGAAYRAIGDYEKAISAFKKAIEARPDNAKAHSKLAQVYYHVKQYDLAIQHCDRAANLGYRSDSEFLKLLEPYR